MLDKIVKISDCPYEIRNACFERDVGPDEEMTISAAIGHWSTWHLGDPHWGTTAANLVATINNQDKVPT